MKNWIKNHKIFLMYSVFGIGTTVMNIGLYMLLSFLFGAELYQLWNVISWIAAVLYSYRVNKKYVFKSNAKTPQESRREFYEFIKGRGFSLVIDTVILFIAVSVMGLNDKIVKIISNIIVVTVNYYCCKKFVFKK